MAERTYDIAVIAGDGIGKEVMPEGIRVLEAATRRYGFTLKQKWHDVAFITLHVLQVLDESRLNPLFGKKPFDLRMIAPLLIKQVLDQRLLLTVKGNDTQSRPHALGKFQPSKHPCRGVIGNGFRFRFVCAAFAAITNCVGEMPERDGTVLRDW